MEQEIIKANMLSFVAAGLLMAVTGALLYFFRGALSGSIRFFLPLPPIGVASYIFVVNLFQHYGGRLPANKWTTLREVVAAAAVTAAAFGLFTFLSIVIINQIRR